MAKKGFQGGIDSILGEMTPNPTPRMELQKNETLIKTTVMIKMQHFNNLKAIAYWDRKTIKEILDESLSMYMEQYIKNNGDIKSID
jgi:hypothetical protein